MITMVMGLGIAVHIYSIILNGLISDVCSISQNQMVVLPYRELHTLGKVFLTI